jgi:predicted Fe-Mo cluster-binding NifX family protein
MKILIATEGNTLDHRVARKFNHASWYLEVDPETLAVNVRNDPKHEQKQEILQEAATHGVTAVIVGNVGPHAFSLLSANGFQAAFAPGATAREALQEFLDGKLKLLDAPTIAQSLEDRERRKTATRLEHAKHQKTKPGGSYAGPTQRGRHHLQQLGGRGH